VLVKAAGDRPARLSPRDELLICHLSEGRLVVEISRSDYRESILGDESWVKVHMVTSKPNDETVKIQIKLLVTLKKEGAGWGVVDVEELALP
jgi:hypothetical protein